MFFSDSERAKKRLLYVLLPLHMSSTNSQVQEVLKNGKKRRKKADPSETLIYFIPVDAMVG